MIAFPCLIINSIANYLLIYYLQANIQVDYYRRHKICLLLSQSNDRREGCVLPRGIKSSVSGLKLRSIIGWVLISYCYTYR